MKEREKEKEKEREEKRDKLSTNKQLKNPVNKQRQKLTRIQIRGSFDCVKIYKGNGSE